MTVQIAYSMQPFTLFLVGNDYKSSSLPTRAKTRVGMFGYGEQSMSQTPHMRTHAAHMTKG